MFKNNVIRFVNNFINYITINIRSCKTTEFKTFKKEKWK